jgi:transposase-like protein
VRARYLCDCCGHSFHADNPPSVGYKVELANKIRGGRAVGNLWGVSRWVGGRRNCWALQPQEDEQRARNLAETSNTAAAMTAPASFAPEGCPECGSLDIRRASQPRREPSYDDSAEVTGRGEY